MCLCSLICSLRTAFMGANQPSFSLSTNQHPTLTCTGKSEILACTFYPQSNNLLNFQCPFLKDFSKVAFFINAGAHGILYQWWSTIIGSGLLWSFTAFEMYIIQRRKIIRYILSWSFHHQSHEFIITKFIQTQKRNMDANQVQTNANTAIQLKRFFSEGSQSVGTIEFFNSYIFFF